MQVRDELGGPRLTVAQWVDRRLRLAILSGELAPGARILPAALAEAWSVSATPLREAIHRLAADGLIDESPRRGARVKRPSRRDLLDLSELRLLLEPRALTLSLQASDAQHRIRMQQAYDDLDAAFDDPAADLLAVEELHRSYHLALFERCASVRLLGFVETLSHHASYYRLLVRRTGIRIGGDQAGRREHAQLLDRCLAGDVDGAEAALRHHLEVTVQAVLALGVDDPEVPSGSGFAVVSPAD